MKNEDKEELRENILGEGKNLCKFFFELVKSLVYLEVGRMLRWLGYIVGERKKGILELLCSKFWKFCFETGILFNGIGSY